MIHPDWLLALYRLAAFPGDQRRLAPNHSTLQQGLAFLLALAFLSSACSPIPQSPAASPSTPDAAPSSVPSVPTAIQVTTVAGPTISGPVVSPYVEVLVTGVQVHTLPTKPVQVELLIQGTLPDQCKYRLYAVDNRQAQKVRVQLRAMHPAESCDQTPQKIEYVFPLGQNLPESQRGFAPGTYELTVNGYQATFSITG